MSVARRFRTTPRGLSIAPALALSLVLALFVGPFSAPSLARADANRDYVARAVLVLDAARRMLAWTEANANNAELARFSHPLSETYVTMVRRLVPPPQYRLVHPHLVLIAENVERAVNAAANEDVRGMRARARTVREELRTLDGVLEHLRVRWPTIAR